jgi:Nucleotidyl transferase AbiEii toxin, Type IV TA system
MGRLMSDIIDALGDISLERGRPFEELLDLHATEGFLRRMQSLPDAETLVLRGSTLTLQYVRPAFRPSGDLDFVTTYPHDPERISAFFAQVCAVSDQDDEVVFHFEGLTNLPTWYYTDSPGVHASIPVTVCGDSRTLQVDVGFNDPLVPPAVKLDYQPLIPGTKLQSLVATPELLCAWKVQGLFDYDPGGWRAKDLYDAYLLIKQTRLDPGLLRQALEVAFRSRHVSIYRLNELYTSAFEMDGYHVWEAFRFSTGERIPLLFDVALHEVRVFFELLRPRPLKTNPLPNAQQSGLRTERSPKRSWWQFWRR